MACDKVSCGQKTALVTGSSNGIGEAIVKRLAKLDYKLIVTGRNTADISRVARECQQLSPSNSKPLEVVAEFSQESDIERLFELSMAHFEHRLDLLVNNAGSGEPAYGSAPEMWQSYKSTMQVNLNAAVLLTLLATEPLKRTASEYCHGKPTSVINIGSIAGSQLTQGGTFYSVSKAALAMFSKCIAYELTPLIRVNCVSPGLVETKIMERSGVPVDLMKAAIKHEIPMQRAGQPDEIAEAVLFLANSDSSGYTTGINMIIDGGRLGKPIKFQLD